MGIKMLVTLRIIGDLKPSCKYTARILVQLKAFVCKKALSMEHQLTAERNS